MFLSLWNWFETSSSVPECCHASRYPGFLVLIVLFSTVTSLEELACSTETLADADNRSHAKRNFNFFFNTFLLTNFFPKQYSANIFVSYGIFLSSERLEYICKCFVESEQHLYLLWALWEFFPIIWIFIYSSIFIKILEDCHLSHFPSLNYFCRLLLILHMHTVRVF